MSIPADPGCRSDDRVRHYLCAEAIRLARMLAVLMADDPEVLG
jgi:predicted RNA polymerase sigma factor